MLCLTWRVLLVSFVTAVTVRAHPGEHHDHESHAAALAERTYHAAHIARGLERCASEPSYIALHKRSNRRRALKAEELRQSRNTPSPGMVRRDLAALEAFEKLNFNHTTKNHKYTASTKPGVLFKSYKNASCILTPEVTDGPYYVNGEYIRSDVAEDQDGVPLHLEYQYIDISTCKPAEGLYVDTWQANATGVYSGVVASGNGNYKDTSNLNNTFLRGLQPTNKHGVAAFDTIFAGHYEGRATHIHLMAHQGGKVLANGTYSSGTVSHIGQIFFPTELKNAVEATSPYSTNTQAVTTNDEDMWAPEQADNNYDPFPSYAYLGDNISDGLLMWIVVGIDLSKDYDSNVSDAATLTSHGGVLNSSGGMGGGNGTGNGTMPSGAAPTGAKPTGSGAPSAA